MVQPMLSATVKDVKALQYPLLGSPKLDGIRAIIHNGKILSRNLKPIPNQYIQKLFGTRDLDGLDGELVVGDPTHPAVFNTTQSGVMAREGKPPVNFFVFDYFTKPPGSKKHEPYVDRSVRLERFCYQIRKEYDGGRVKFWQQVEIDSQERLLHLEDAWVSSGYEGIMLRDPDGGYKFGRSTLREGWLMKKKLFEDSEADIVEFVEEMQNLNELKTERTGRRKRSHRKENLVPKNTLGALIVRDRKTKVMFNIGGGFTDVQREWIWNNKAKAKRQIVKYKFQPSGIKEKPRFPTFMGFRSKNDL